MSTSLEKIKAKPLGQVTNVRELLLNDGAKGQLQQVAAAHMKPERMMRLMANAVRTTPKLAECDPMSLLGGLMTCAGLGLEPNTIMGHAYLIPFRNNKKNLTEVQLVIGYKGLIDLARRSGHITSIAAGVHYSDDDLWDYEEGTEARLRHIPGAQEGDKRHAYAIAKFKDGGHAYVVLPWAKVMKTRDGSQGWQTAVRYGKQKQSPWALYEDEMAKKTAVRALAKFLPLSVEFRDAMTVDGSRTDFAAFAMDPAGQLDITPDDDDGGAMIDGEVSAGGDEDSGEDEDQPEQKDSEPEKQQAKPKQEAAKSKAEPKKADDDTAASETADLVKRIVDDINDQPDAEAVQDTLSLWDDMIGVLPPEAQKQIGDAADKKSSSFSK